MHAPVRAAARLNPVRTLALLVPFAILLCFAAPLAGATDPDLTNLGRCATGQECHEPFTICIESYACQHQLVCVTTYGGKVACVYDPCSEMACF